MGILKRQKKKRTLRVRWRCSLQDAATTCRSMGTNKRWESEHLEVCRMDLLEVGLRPLLN